MTHNAASSKDVIPAVTATALLPQRKMLYLHSGKTTINTFIFILTSESVSRDDLCPAVSIFINMGCSQDSIYMKIYSTLTLKEIIVTFLFTKLESVSALSLT